MHRNNLVQQKGTYHESVDSQTSQASTDSLASKNSKNPRNAENSPLEELYATPDLRSAPWIRSSPLEGSGINRGVNEAGVQPVMDRVRGTMDGKAYFQLCQYFNDGRKFTQTCWNKKIRITGEVSQLNFLIKKLAANFNYIDGAYLYDIRKPADSPGYVLLRVQDGKLIFVHPSLYKTEDYTAKVDKKNKLDLQPIRSILNTQFNDKL